MIKNIIAQGIGFSPATLKWIPTLGFSIGAAIIIVPPPPPTGFDQVVESSTPILGPLIPFLSTVPDIGR